MIGIINLQQSTFSPEGCVNIWDNLHDNTSAAQPSECCDKGPSECCDKGMVYARVISKLYVV